MYGLGMFGGCALITTYRCNAHCQMCNRWKHQTKANDEFKAELVLKVPRIHFINITGGEPFLRDDIEDIVKYAHKRANRVVISTNGIMKSKIVSVMKKYPKTGLRVSVEGIGDTNNRIRGIENGYYNAMALLRELKELGCKDIGVSITIHDGNYQDVLPLYHICKERGYEFATGVVHSSFFFESDGETKPEYDVEICETLWELAGEMMKSKNVKEKYRALFNEELIRHTQEKPNSFPCKCGEHFFAIDPSGKVLSCVGSEQPRVMGDLTNHTFKEVWYSSQAIKVKQECASCNRNCCMSGNVAGEMRRNALKLSERITI